MLWHTGIFHKLSILDRFLTPAILLTMIIGVIIGEFVPSIQQAFDVARFDSVSVRKSTTTAHTGHLTHSISL
jgi:ACR3 family arsenite transporter